MYSGVVGLAVVWYCRRDWRISFRIMTQGMRSDFRSGETEGVDLKLFDAEWWVTLVRCVVEKKGGGVGDENLEPETFIHASN